MDSRQADLYYSNDTEVNDVERLQTRKFPSIKSSKGIKSVASPVELTTKNRYEIFR